MGGGEQDIRGRGGDREFHERLVDYLYGEMSREEREDFERLAASSPDLAAELDRYRTLLRQLDDIEEPVPPPAAVEEVLAAARRACGEARRPGRASFAQMLAWLIRQPVGVGLAALLVVAVGVYMASEVRRPERPESRRGASEEMRPTSPPGAPEKEKTEAAAPSPEEKKVAEEVPAPEGSGKIGSPAPPAQEDKGVVSRVPEGPAEEAAEPVHGEQREQAARFARTGEGYEGAEEVPALGDESGTQEKTVDAPETAGERPSPEKVPAVTRALVTSAAADLEGEDRRRRGAEPGRPEERAAAAEEDGLTREPGREREGAAEWEPRRKESAKKKEETGIKVTNEIEARVTGAGGAGTPVQGKPDTAAAGDATVPALDQALKTPSDGRLDAGSVREEKPEVAWGAVYVDGDAAKRSREGPARGLDDEAFSKDKGGAVVAGLKEAEEKSAEAAKPKPPPEPKPEPVPVAETAAPAVAAQPAPEEHEAQTSLPGAGAPAVMAPAVMEAGPEPKSETDSGKSEKTKKDVCGELWKELLALQSAGRYDKALAVLDKLRTGECAGQYGEETLGMKEAELLVASGRHDRARKVLEKLNVPAMEKKALDTMIEDSTQ